MTLITTAGDQAADSYVTTDEFNEYSKKYGYNLAGFKDEDIEQACRRGTRWLDATYGNRFIGKVASVDQSLEWPRKEAVWRGCSVNDAIIPVAIKNAACEAIWRELTKPNSLAPDYIQSEAVKQEEVGEISVTYKDGKGTAEDVMPVITIIDRLLSGFTNPKAKSALFGICARA